MKKDFMTKAKKQKNINKTINVICKRNIHNHNGIYNKKVISKNINENIKKKKLVNIYNSITSSKNHKKKFKTNGTLKKSIELIDNLRIKLIEFSLKDNCS